MDSNRFPNLADLARSFNALHLFPQLVNPAIEQERLVNEIAAIAKTTPDEVKKFYQSHSYSLEFIKGAVALCGTLDKDEMEKAVTRQISPTPFSELAKAINGLLPKPTWKDRIAALPYNAAYYISYPFIWLLRELWDGLHDAWESIFNEC